MVEEAWKSEAKDLILAADSISAMFTAAEESIDEDWLGDVDELPGNIYRIAALGTLTGGLFESGVEPSETFSRLVRLVGCITIFLIQICGPPLLIASVYFDWGVLRESDISWGDWEPSFSDWAAIKTTKVLSTLFLFVFSINGLYVILQEKQSWLKIYKTFRYLKHNTPNMDVRGEPFLILGPIVNSWVILLTCIASFTILGASFSPRNVLFDALGLLFLYNLDDIEGDLGFVSADDWDGLRLGWVYKEMVAPNYTNCNVKCEEQLTYDADDIGRTGWHAVRRRLDAAAGWRADHADRGVRYPVPRNRSRGLRLRPHPKTLRLNARYTAARGPCSRRAYSCT
ncbi:unnamed protein product [Prorocentrum cordatum]|uniref:Uncharacterized protein n=1 Tax=Prorocentrum cordatum TaxID=2364126 RepID=A0ABN9PTH7_9DINO|nr:unnamed protein product [Polarella glacialis]